MQESFPDTGTGAASLPAFAFHIGKVDIEILVPQWSNQEPIQEFYNMTMHFVSAATWTRPELKKVAVETLTEASFDSFGADGGFIS